jgi:DNA-binding winged helix-turn-helix (wHTH) protein
MLALAPTTCAGGCAEHCPPPLVTIGPLVVDIENYQAAVDGQLVALSATELRLLRCLARRAGSLCTSPALIDAIWGEDWGHGPDEMHGLRVYVHRLKKRLGHAGSLIRSIPGIGYRLSETPWGPSAIEPALRIVESAKPRPLGMRGRQVIELLLATDGGRCSLRNVADVVFSGHDSTTRYAIRVIVKRLRSQGYAIACETAPAPEWGWVTLATEGAP